MNKGRVRRIINYAAGLLMMVSPCVFSDDEEIPSWFSGDLLPDEPWKEQQNELPAYPEKANLLEVDINTGGQPYRLYIDPLSVRPGDDQVVRYTVVIISTTGIWNVSNEGLHCGERKYRRYAYGYEGAWRKQEESPWLPVAGLGINRYRRLFYNDYMCDQIEPYGNARVIIEKFRSKDFRVDD